MSQHARRVMQGMLLVGVMVVGAGNASATIQNLTAFKKVYPQAKGACIICHTAAIGKSTNLNTYGAAIQALKATPEGAALTAEEALKKLDGEDADQDGATNAAEIAAGTNPGDPVPATP